MSAPFAKDLTANNVIGLAMTLYAINADLSVTTKRKDWAMKLSNKYLLAAMNMDWQQVALNHTYGPPCFHLERGKFCGRAKGWHDDYTEKEFHPYTPLQNLLEIYRKAEGR